MSSVGGKRAESGGKTTLASAATSPRYTVSPNEAFLNSRYASPSSPGVLQLPTPKSLQDEQFNRRMKFHSPLPSIAQINSVPSEMGLMLYIISNQMQLLAFRGPIGRSGTRRANVGKSHNNQLQLGRRPCVGIHKLKVRRTTG